eukprot:1181850-Prorocentrum_minimum.AAC.1
MAPPEGGVRLSPRFARRAGDASARAATGPVRANMPYRGSRLAGPLTCSRCSTSSSTRPAVSMGTRTDPPPRSTFATVSAAQSASQPFSQSDRQPVSQSASQSVRRPLSLASFSSRSV